MGTLLELKDVSKLYGFGDATTVALDEITLSVKGGEFVAVMGPSGSGKTTLMNVIGLLDRPTHGVYRLNTKPVEQLRPSRQAKIRREHVGFVFQSFNLLPKLTVLDNVALPLAYKGMPLTRRQRRAAEILDRVGLADRQYFLPRQLSGGQAQRVAIARALINNPDIIIADEPTGNLDSYSSRLVMELLSDLHKAGNTILLVTHNPELTRYAGRVVFMHDGSVIADEISVVGEVPDRVHHSMYFESRKTEEDDLAGISALMAAIPEKLLAPKKKQSKTKKKAKSGASYKSRGKKRGKK